MIIILLLLERLTLEQPFTYLQHDHRMRKNFSSGS
eukprot:UN23995